MKRITRHKNTVILVKCKYCTDTTPIFLNSILPLILGRYRKMQYSKPCVKWPISNRMHRKLRRQGSSGISINTSDWSFAIIPEQVTGKERKKLFQKFSKHQETADLFNDENKMKEFMRSVQFYIWRVGLVQWLRWRQSENLWTPVRESLDLVRLTLMITFLQKHNRKLKTR